MKLLVAPGASSTIQQKRAAGDGSVDGDSAKKLL